MGECLCTEKLHVSALGADYGGHIHAVHVSNLEWRDLGVFDGNELELAWYKFQRAVKAAISAFRLTINADAFSKVGEFRNI